MKKNNNKGFTLIELLVVIAIIGLLSTLAVVALNSARQRSRDAKRVADIRQVQTALELGFSETQEYPTATAPGVTLGVSASSTLVLCSDAGGSVFEDVATDCDGTVFMGLVPSSPTPPAGSVYTYTSADGSDYGIDFTLEGATGQLVSGQQCATPDGITSGACS